MTINTLENEYKKLVDLLGDEILKLNNKSFFITGATGLVASYLVDFIMWYNTAYSQNIYVYAVSSKLEKLQKRFKANKNLCFIEQNLNEPLKKKYEADYIIHAASNAHPLPYSKYPVGPMNTNLTGPMNI